MVNIFVRAEEGFTNMVAGSTTRTRRVIVTNRPEAVRLGEAQPRKAAELTPVHRANNSHGYTREREVQVDSSRLGHGGFVTILTHTSQEHCGCRHGEELRVLAGRSVELADLSYGSAFACWAEEMEEEAYSFLRWFAGVAKADQPTRHALRFAAGRANSFAPHAQRREAWVKALRGLGYTGPTGRIIGSVRTATVKAALQFGWEPSVPKPDFWEGLPKGVVEITL